MRVEEPDYIDRTRYSVSLVAALGYKAQKVVKGDYLEDWYKLVSEKGKEYFVKRKDFLEWAMTKHKNLRVV